MALSICWLGHIRVERGAHSYGWLTVLFRGGLQYDQISHVTGGFVGHYELLEHIGQGGMGVVWRARDTQLGRDVALKLLPDHLTHDQTRRVRFEREARILAALNHPNIAAVYGFETVEGTSALIMEYVSGATLDKRLERGALPVEDVVEFAMQIASGLERAHETGIVHRDLKPGNIIITPERRVKILDFGLAKVLESNADPEDPAAAHTVTLDRTRLGTVIGTPAYLSPEQSRGDAADQRSDVWAFGVVVYEMLTRKRLFKRDNVSDTLAAVLTLDPDWELLPERTPAALGRLLHRCLERDREKRLRHIGDALLDLSDSARELSAPARLVRKIHRSFLFSSLLLVIGILAGVAGAVMYHRRQSVIASQPARHFTITLPAFTDSTLARSAVIAPDGRFIVYVAENKLWLRNLDQPRPRVLEGTDDARAPFWSPDSGWIGYVADAELKKVQVSGGTPVSIASLGTTRFRGAAWSPNGETIVFGLFTEGGGLWEVPARGGAPKLVWKSPTQVTRYLFNPLFIPSSRDSRTILCGFGGVNRQRLMLVDLTTGEYRDIGEGAYPAYSPTGHIIFQTDVSRTGLWAVPFSLTGNEITGERFPFYPDAQRPSISEDGTLIYLEVFSRKQQLVWRDRNGSLLGTIGPPRTSMRSPDVSPDGTRVAISSLYEVNEDIWIYETERPATSRLTSNAATDQWPRWMPDGKYVSYTSDRNGTMDIYMQTADTPGDAVLLSRSPDRKATGNWSLDGQYGVQSRLTPQGQWDLWLLTRKPDRTYQASPMLQGPFEEILPEISPDGKYLAYVTNETGRREVYVREFPTGERTRLISAAGGQSPRWARSKSELFYVEDNTLIAVNMSTIGTRSHKSTRLFASDQFGAHFGNAGYAVAADGKRFVLVEDLPGQAESPPSMHVIINWSSSQLTPAGK